MMFFRNSPSNEIAVFLRSRYQAFKIRIGLTGAIDGEGKLTVDSYKDATRR
jgi:hypothetical protein